jgi:hypothetical protein
MIIKVVANYDNPFWLNLNRRKKKEKSLFIILLFSAIIIPAGQALAFPCLSVGNKVS